MKYRDNIYYSYRFNNKKTKKWYWKLYCVFRKHITLRESPSKVNMWVWSGCKNENIK